MKDTAFKRNLSIVAMILILLVLLFSSSPYVHADWYENLDDGDISDWSIENPMPGCTKPVTIEASTEHSFSPSYSLKVSGPPNDPYGAQATGPDAQIDSNLAYTIEFQFRWHYVHWVRFAIFQHVHLIIAYPNYKIKYVDDSGHHYLSGTPKFEDYCPEDTWTHFRIDVTPSDSSYTIIVNGDTIGIVYYGSYNSGENGFSFIEGCNSPNWIENGYYDDIIIYQAGRLRGDANGDGAINIADAMYIINYLFTGGPAPDPLWVGDANCDGAVNIADAMYLINYLFAGGPPPGC